MLIPPASRRVVTIEALPALLEAAARGFYGPWDSVEDALAGVPSGKRYKGLTVGILTEGIVDDYWFKTGTGDEHLELKQTGGSSPEGEGNNFILF